MLCFLLIHLFQMFTLKINYTIRSSHCSLAISFFPTVVSPLQLLGRTQSAMFAMARIRPPRGRPPRLLPSSGGFQCLAYEAPLIRGMPTGPREFLAMPDAGGLRPCNRTHHKNGLWAYDKYRSSWFFFYCRIQKGFSFICMVQITWTFVKICFKINSD